MIKLLIDFIQFLYTLAPLFLALGVLTLLAVLLSKSIKRHATVYYIVFAIPFALVAIPFIGRLFGIEMFSFSRIPFLGGIIRDYIHAGTLGFPLLIIIMYMGALNPKNTVVKRLLSIRKELSILSGFPILTHSLIRVTGIFPRALNYFIDSEAGERAANSLGAGISNFSFVLGVLMLALFIPLWISSFDSVHKCMGGVRWKKLQRWSYILYATLFIHAMGIQVGGILNPREERGATRPSVEVTATSTKTVESPAHRNRRNSEVQGSAGRGGHQQSLGFADITVGSQTKRYVHIASLFLIFGSYLYLRVRKAR